MENERPWEKKLTAGSDWEKIFAEYKPSMVSYLEDTGKERKKKKEVQLEKKREANPNNSNNKKTGNSSRRTQKANQHMKIHTMSVVLRSEAKQEYTPLYWLEEQKAES